MLSKKEIVISYFEEVSRKKNKSFKGITTTELSEHLSMQRANLSTILNQLVKEGIVSKSSTRPVVYQLVSLQARQSLSKDRFAKLIGHDQSLKNCVQLAKAAIMYPEESMNTLIIGESGTGKSYFASLMYEFAKEQNIVSQDAPFVSFDCQYYANNEEDLLSQLFGLDENYAQSAFYKAAGGVLFIDHIEVLDLKIKKILADYLDEKEEMIIICSTSEYNDFFYELFPVHLELPSLKHRSLEERLEFVEKFFMDEAEKMKKSLKINSELLRCFLLYYCQGNVKQLRNDIRIGCANAFVREINAKSDILQVYMNDFHSYIRKGFIFYKENREKIEALIPENYTYTFTPDRSKKQEEELFNSETQNSIYDFIRDKVNELRQRDIQEEDIMTIISADIDSDILQVQQKMDTSNFNIDALKKVVGRDVIELVDNFLQKASARYKKIYQIATFYSLCLHLSSCIKKQPHFQNLSNEKIIEIVEKYKDEYTFCNQFAAIVEDKIDVRMTTDEIVITTLLLCQDYQRECDDQRPVILIVMHGNVASAIVSTVHKIYPSQKIYAFDLQLDKDMEEAYEELKIMCRSIDGGHGFLIIYDMGSLRIVCESLIQELQINARMIEIPITMVVLDCAIKLGTASTIDEVYEDIVCNHFGSFGTLQEAYHRRSEKPEKVIITLCQEGEDTAAQIKQYLEKNLDQDDVEIVALAIKKPKNLLYELNRRQETQKILCIVGTYDPQLYDIPFISVAKIFDTPADKLPMLLALKDVELNNAFDYSAVYDYLEEQLPAVDISKLKKHLPRALSKIKKCTPDFTLNEEVGLFLHISCAINRMLSDEEMPVNIHKDQTINKHKRLYHELMEILDPLAKAMNVQFSDNELATIIEILV